MAAYQVGETIRLIATITDNDDVAVDPIITKISINSPDGEIAVASSDMIKSEIGSYYYDYLIPDDTGTYSWKVTGTGSGGRITIVKNSFSTEISI